MTARHRRLEARRRRQESFSAQFASPPEDVKTPKPKTPKPPKKKSTTAAKKSTQKG